MTPTQLAPTRRRLWLILAVALAAVAVLIAALLLARPDGGRRESAAVAVTSSAVAKTLTVQGRLELGLGDFQWDSIGSVGQPGPWCAGRGGYDDIAIGAPVTITGPAGEVVALGKLDVSNPTGFSEAKTPTSCELRFSVAKVPPGKGFYGVEVSHRGAVKFDEAALAESVELKLG